MEKKYDLGSDKEKSIEDKVDKFLDTKKLDESNPLERAKKFSKVKENPPAKEYMKVDLIKEIEDGKEVIYSRSKGPDGKSEEKKSKENIFYTIDLNTLILADIAACPSNTIPMLIDQAVQLAMNERKAFKVEKRKEGFNYWWIVLGLLMLPGIILVILLFLRGG